MTPELIVQAEALALAAGVLGFGGGLAVLGLMWVAEKVRP